MDIDYIELSGRIEDHEARIKALESKKRSKKTLIIPTAQEVDDYFREIGGYQSGIGQRFINHYSQVDWCYKRDVRIVDWRATARLWVERSQKQNTNDDKYSHMA